MATTKKQTKKVTQKAAANTETKKVIKKKTDKKTSAKKVPTQKAQSRNNKINVTQEQRYKMICEAAYYISLNKTYKTVNPTTDWLQAETAIDLICAVHSKPG